MDFFALGMLIGFGMCMYYATYEDDFKWYVWIIVPLFFWVIIGITLAKYFEEKGVEEK